MKKYINPLYLFGIIITLWISIFTYCFILLTELRISYLLFSLIINAGLILALLQRRSYLYLYLSIFTWLGLWLKFSIHAIFSYPFIEPVGGFEGTAKNWEAVLDISSLAYSGIIFSGLLMLFIFNKLKVISDHKISPPSWYLPVRKKLWLTIFVVLIVTCFINVVLGIHRIGLLPDVILIWPMNALIAWLLNIGTITAILTLVWWDISLGLFIGYSIYAIIFEAFSSSVSVMSRALYVFHLVPPLLSMSMDKRYRLVSWNYKNTICLVFTAIFFLVVSISMVTTLRNYFYQEGSYQSTRQQVLASKIESTENEILRIKSLLIVGNDKNNEKLKKQLLELERSYNILLLELKKEDGKVELSSNQKTLVLINEFQYQIKNGVFERILFLSVDRWIGLEGIMAVQAASNKDIDTLFKAITFRGGEKESDTFQKISRSIYEERSGVKFIFRSLPGFIAFLYYSGSFLIVFLGAFFLTSLGMLLEAGISYLTENRLLVSLYSAEIANNIAQFGGEPRQTLRYFMILSLGIGFVWFVSSKYFLSLLRVLQIYKVDAIKVGE